jgi:hypothetical protein
VGKAKTAKFIETSLPTSKSVRSGDLGEVLGVTYLAEFTEFKLHVKRLRWKDHRNMAMRGEDILAFAVNDEGNLLVLKGEQKVARLSTRPRSKMQERRWQLTTVARLRMHWHSWLRGTSKWATRQ